ncbi:MAG TPA: universal stress protein [Polyangiaceae bacterium]
MNPTKKSYVVVVGVDHSGASRLALREAFAIAARRPPSEVHVLQVQTAILPYPYPFPKLQASAAEMWSWLLRRLQHFVADELAAFQESQRRSGARPFGHVVAHLRSDSPGREIAQLAADLEADLVVVGTHGRGGLTRLLMGSTAHAVVTLSPCPVLVVREKGLLPPGPMLEPPCPRCLEQRKRTNGDLLWCDQHREHHGQRHANRHHFPSHEDGSPTNSKSN